MLEPIAQSVKPHPLTLFSKELKQYGILTQQISQGGQYYLFLNSKKRVEALRRVPGLRDCSVTTPGFSLPQIPPDPKDATSDYSWTWLTAQSKEVQKEYLAAERRKNQTFKQTLLF